MMKKILLGMLLVFVGLYFLFTHYFGDVTINKYDSIKSVHANKAIEKGWIPSILPASAYDIVETHDIDTNKNFGTFSYKEKDEESFLGHLVESNETYEGDAFLFKIDKEKNKVRFRNKI